MALRPSLHALRAFSLLELTIAMAVLITAVAMVLQGMVSTQRVTAMGNAQDDIAFDSDRVMNAIAADLSLSGWDGIGGAGNTFAQDRNDYYFPYIQQQASPDIGGVMMTQGLGQQIAHSHRNLAMVDLRLPDVLPGEPEDFNTDFAEGDAVQRQRYLSSYHARSQELHFLRISRGPWTDQPEPHSQMRERFAEGNWELQTEANRDALGILHPSAWRETALNSSIFVERLDPGAFDPVSGNMIYGHVIHGGRLQIDGGDITLLPRWETVDPPDYLNPAADVWREYQYAVVPSPVGFGRLVRAMRVRIATVAGATEGVEVGQFITPVGQLFGMQVQEVLSDHVVRVVFNTYRSDPGLDLNQVGVRVYFARPSIMDPTLVITRAVETVLAMRTRASESDNSEILTWVNTSVGFDF